jgi:hypothetical protein
MALMTVNSRNERGKGYRWQPRWSAGKRMDVVLRLLRLESLEELWRELKVQAHRLAAWRDDFLAAGKQGLKSRERPPSILKGRVSFPSSPGCDRVRPRLDVRRLHARPCQDGADLLPVGVPVMKGLRHQDPGVRLVCPLVQDDHALGVERF